MSATPPNSANSSSLPNGDDVAADAPLGEGMNQKIYSIYGSKPTGRETGTVDMRQRYEEKKAMSEKQQ